MANWKLGTPHYLNLSDQASWEYKEVDRKTGRPKVVRFPVPTLLNPEDPGDWTERDGEEGICVVSDGNNPRGRAHIFSGPPTPDMVPLDDEARAITKKLEPVWGQGPIEGLPGSYADALFNDLQGQVAKLQASASAAAPAKVEGMTELLGALAGMMKQNQEILDRITAPAPTSRRA